VRTAHTSRPAALLAPNSVSSGAPFIIWIGSKSPCMSSPPKQSSFQTLRRLAAQAGPFWPRIGLVFVVSLLSTPLSLLTPFPLALIVDSVLGDKELPAIVTSMLPAGISRTSATTAAILAGSGIAIVLTKHLLDMLQAWMRTSISEKLVLSFRSTLFRHTQRLSLAYHDAQGAADSAYRIQYDAPAIQWIVVDALLSLSSALITLAMGIVVLWRMDWQLALVALAVVPVLSGTSVYFTNRLKTHWHEAKDLESSAHSVIHEVLGAVRVVKAFVAEDREQARFEKRARLNLKEQLRLAMLSSSFAMIVGVTMATGTAIVLFIGALHVQSGILTLGNLTLVMSYLLLLYSPMETLTRSAGGIQGSLASAERAFELLDQKPEVEERPDARAIDRARGHIVFQDVSFAYRSDRSALENISFEIPTGAHVGIAGHTGAGKSTLISLLLRLYDPTGGRILLDGLDIRDYDLRDLRNQFSLVLQDPVLFSTSIGENIAYAKPEASQDEIVAAARAANVHDFISKLARGYDTPVGERGFALSGGERQRISLARAFLRDAPILILDEPTSSVDVKTEAAIIDGIERLMKGRTSFMIAHRLSTLDMCDIRLELGGGHLLDFATSARRAAAATQPAPIPH
jgi:ATP-binding cassette subfamily B protein